MQERESVVLVQKDGPICTVSINNPPLNILDLDVRAKLLEVFQEINNDMETTVVILEGMGGKAFSVGSNINEFPLAEGVQGGIEKAEFEHKLHNLLEGLPQVTIACINGFALGGGGELMLSCDMRVASERSAFGFPEVKLGAFPCSGGTQRLMRVVGYSKAKELMFFGDPIDAAEALRLGLVNKVVPTDKLEETVKGMANRLAEKPFGALKAIKSSVNAGLWGTMKDGVEKEVETFGELFKTKDLIEGLQAFKEKRKPNFKNC